jgi:acyl-CoA reductase LuxC
VSICVPGYHLPGGDSDIATEVCRVGTLEVEMSRPTAAQLHDAIGAASQAGLRQLRGRSVEDVLKVLDHVAAAWLSPDYHVRQAAEQLLPLATGYSVETIRHGLPLHFVPLRAAPLRALLDAELGDRFALDHAINGRRVVGPRFTTHVIPGNIPGLAALPIFVSLAFKSVVLVKPAGGDPITPALIASSIAEVDEALAQCVLVVNWRGGDREIEDVGLGYADLVVASGSDQAIAAIADSTRRRFIGHGHRISFALIGKERLSDREAARVLAERLAYDVSLWDQQGCLSPQLCYVESGGAVDPAAFAKLLAESLAECARGLPARHLTLEEKADVLRFREEAEWRRVGGEAAAVYASPGSADWSISIEHDAEFSPTCLNRCIRLKVIDTLATIPPALAAHRRHLEATGIAVGADHVDALVEMLAACGVHRVCPIGAMQQPPLSWPQGGRPRIGDWVEWMHIEGGLGA